MAITHRHNIPVVVGAATQLPLTEDLWECTSMGAGVMVFSGGKTLCGPRDGSLILGKREWIEGCKRSGTPAHRIYRINKTPRGAIAGLYTVLSNSLAVDDE